MLFVVWYLRYNRVMTAQNVKNKIKLKMDKANLIGLGVLTLGVLVLLFVGYVAYQKLSPSNNSEKTEKRAEVPLYEQQGRKPNRAAGEKPVQQAYARQDSISEEELRGSWESLLPKGRALLEMKRGKYRLIMLSNRRQNYAQYSNGTYEIVKDIVVLQPNLKSKPPKTKGLKYEVLTRGKIPVAAALYKGKLIWQKPPSGTGLYIPRYNPVLSKANNDIVVWKVLK